MLTPPSTFGRPEPRVILDGEGRILNWNEEVERLLGESCPLQGRKLTEYLSGGDARALTGWLAELRAHEGRSLMPQPLTLRNLGGDARRVELTSQAMSGKNAFCLLVHPLPAPSCPILVTLEHQPAPTVVLQLPDPQDPESLLILGLNAAARAKAGQAAAAWAGRRLVQALPLAREAGWLEALAAVARGGGARELDLRPLRPQHPGWPARLALWPLPEGCVGVSPQAEAENTVDSNGIFSQIVEEMPTAVTVWALPKGADAPEELRLIAANRAAEALLSGTKLLGRSLRELLPAEASAEPWRPLVVAIQGRQALTLSERALTGRDGMTRTFARQCVPLEGRLVAVLCVDVTERKRAEEEIARQNRDLAQRNAELASANQEVALFDDALCYDLQEPLGVLARDAEQVARRYRPLLDASGAQLLEAIARSAQRIRGLNQRMRAYAALDPHSRHREAVSLEDVAAQALAELRPALEEASAWVEVSALPLVEADPAQMEQLYREILANALKFRGSSPLRIEVGARAKPGEWLLWVRDTGSGVPPHLAERIFDLFTRGPGSPRKPRFHQEPSAGVGLALCRKVVQAHGGCLWTEPTPGGGATFCFTLPRGR